MTDNPPFDLILGTTWVLTFLMLGDVWVEMLLWFKAACTGETSIGVDALEAGGSGAASRS